MWITIKKLLAQLLFWVYDFIDLIGDIFRVLVGLSPVSVDGSKMTLLEVFVSHTVFSKILFGLVIVAVVVAIVCCIVKIVSTTLSFKNGHREQPSHLRRVGLTFSSIATAMVCIFFVGLFMAFSSFLVKAVDAVTLPATEGNTHFSNYLFDLSVENSYRYDFEHPKYKTIIKTDENGNPIQKTDPNGNLIWKTNEYGNYVDKNDIEILNQADVSQRVPIYESTEEIYYDYFYTTDSNGNIIKQSSSGYRDGYTANDLNFQTMSPTDVFGRHFTISGLENEWMPYTQEPMVDLESFNLLTAYLVAFVMLLSLVFICIGMTKRLYDIIVLIFMMPLVCGTIPLDDGTRFKAWRETLMSKLLLAVGAVLSINVFFQVAPLISMIDFSVVSSSILVQNLVKMFLFMGGALCINTSQTLIARVLGTSADESRELAQTVRTLIAGASMAGGALLGAKNFVLGGKNRYGRERVGMVPMMARGANFAGSLLGGDRYTASAAGKFTRWAGGMSGPRISAAGIRSALGADGGKSATTRTATTSTGTGRAGEHSASAGAPHTKSVPLGTRTSKSSGAFRKPKKGR